MRTIRPTMTALAAASTLLLSGLVIAPQAGASTLYACVKKSGTARFVSARTRCRRGEAKLSWNTQGVAGKNGSPGKNGTTGKNGANGKNGASGKDGTNGKDGANGSSAGLVDFNDNPFELSLTRQTIATLPNVPAGSYILVAKTQVEDTSATEGAEVHCYLAGSDEAVATLDAKGGAATLSLMTAGATPFTSIFTLECNDFGTAGIKVAFARIAAIQVQTLTATTG
jgi:hypothetical protein